MKVKSRLEHKINVTLRVLLPNKIERASRGPATSSDRNRQDKPNSRDKRAIPLLVIAQGTAAIGGMLIKGINTLVDAKRANSFNNAIKMLNANVESSIYHRHIEHFFAFFAGNTVFSLVSELPR